MTYQLLRSALKEAKKKAQVGLFLWPTWTQWEDFAFELKKGQKNYDFALAQVAQGKEATITLEWNGLKMPGILAVSVEKLLSSDEFFTHVLSICEKNHYTGPITLVPLNQVSESC